MSSTSDVRIRSLINEALANIFGEGFLGQGFINTMRFTTLNPSDDEEFYNAFLYGRWHAVAAGGLQQVREQVSDYNRLKKDETVWATISPSTKEKMENLIALVGQYKTTLPIDSVHNIKVMYRLSDYNSNIAWAIGTLYEHHIAILNGRMARNGAHMTNMKEVGQNANANEKDVQVGDSEKKHFWNRGNGE